MQRHMADRYRDRPSQDDGYGRDDYGAPQRPAESDPLAELARLIGQTDPFSSFGREPPANAQPDDYSEGDDGGTYDENSTTEPTWMRNARAAYDAPISNVPRGRQDGRYADDGRGYDSGPQCNQEPPDGTPARYDEVRFGQRELKLAVA